MTKSINLLIIILLAFPLVSSACLTNIERANLWQVANSTGANPDIYINTLERICLSDETKNQINAFNSTLTSRLDDIDNKVTNTLNNSALVTTLTQISNMYNASITITNFSLIIDEKVSQSESRLNFRLDNNTYSLTNEFQDFKNEVNDMLVEKQTKNLTTNRIILIVIGLVALGGGFYYYSTKKIKAKPNISPLPYDNRHLEPGVLKDDKRSNTSKSKK